MRMKLSFPCVVLFLGLLIGCKSEPKPSSAPPPRPRPSAPNVLLITLDAVRADRLGCYGYSPAKTPALDSLAVGGVRFSHAFSQSPLTLPSHASMLTGLHPAEHSLVEDGLHSFPDEITTLAEVFNQRGFNTAAFIGGAFLDAFYGLEQGFQVYDDQFDNPEPVPEDRLVRPAKQVTDAALQWFAERSVQPDRLPFFCWVNLADARTVDDLSGQVDASLQQHYDQQLTLIDAQIERLIDSLRRSHSIGNTLVVVAGAHGEALGDHFERGRGLFLYSSTLHVPLIFSSPGRLPAGRTVSATVRLLDVFPTILDFEDWPLAVNVVTADQADSLASARSLLSALRGERIDSRPSYARTDFPDQRFGWSPLRSLTTQSLHYVDAPTPELYDLHTDPSQSSNLAPADPQSVADARALLAEVQNSITDRPPDRPKLSRESVHILASLPEFPDEYREAFTAASEDRPDPKDRIDAYRAYLLGSSLLDRHEYDQALRYLTDAAARSPASPYILSSLAKLYRGQNRLEESYRNLRLALALRPADPALLSQMASLLMAVNQFPQAINYCRLSLELKNLQPETHNDLAVLLFAEKQTSVALAALQRALEIRPNYADAHFNLAVLLVNSGRETEALSHFRSATEGLPDFTEAFFQWALLLASHKRNSEAAEKYQRVLELDPSRVDARYLLAEIFSLQSKFGPAVEHYRTALKDIAQQQDLDPKAYQVWEALLHQGLGIALFKNGDIAEASDHLQQAVKLRDDLPDAHYWLAQVFMSEGRDDQAIEHFQHALHLRPFFPEASKPLSQLALAKSTRLAKDGQFAQAINLLIDVRRIMPHDLDVTNALGRYFATCPNPRMRRGEMAVRLARQAVVSTAYSNPYFLDTLAAAYAEVGNFEKALQAASQAYDAANRLGNRELMMDISVRVDLYKAGQPYRETPE